MLLPGNEGKTVAHFQQVAGNVFHQLFFNIPFVCFFFGSCQIKDVRVFEQVIGKVALWSRKCGREIVYLVVADLSAIQITVNLHFQYIAAPSHFHRLLHVPVA